MAVVAPSSPETLDSKLDQSEHQNAQSTSQIPTTPPSASTPLVAPENPNPNPIHNPNFNPNPSITPPPPPSAPSFTPSFRPVGAPQIPQFSPIPNPGIQNHNFQGNPNLQPPGVAAPVSITFPGATGGPGAVTVSMSSGPPLGMYYSAPGQAPGAAPRSFWLPSNGYTGVPGPPQAPGLIPPPGIARFPGQYPPMVRLGFPPRPPMPVGVIPPLSRPQVPGAPIVSPVVRPVVPIVAPTEKPQTTVYVGKIASSVENDFLLSLLRLCGPVKSWKRAQDPSDGTPRGFGFCEFESAEGVLRALRLLTKLNIDGQELVLNVNQATREYLERYVEKKTEREKLKEADDDGVSKENGTQEVEKQEPPTVNENSKKEADKSEDKEKEDDPQKFGLVTNEDRETDREALEKLKNMIEERLKAKPLPPPPPVSAGADGTAKSNSEFPTKSRDGDSDVDIIRSAEDRNEEDVTSGNKPSTEHDKLDANLSDKGRRSDRGRERDRERDSKRDKERELERYERERERERVRRERERDLKIREVERRYKDRVKECEAREREKEYQRQYEKEREKERESKRRREIMDQEDESDDDDTRKRRHRGSAVEDKKRRMQREKEEDHADRLREEEEIVDAKQQAIEEQRRKDDPKKLSAPASNGTNEDEMQNDKMNIDGMENFINQANEIISTTVDNAGDVNIRNGSSDESNMGSISMVDVKQSSNSSSRKLGFGLIGSGKRTSVPSVFHEEDEDVDKDNKMRPLVPIDYTTEELQAVQTTVSGTPPNLAAAAEFAKRIGNHKEEKAEPQRERSRRNSDKHRERDRSDGESKHARSENREKVHDKILERDKERGDKPKTTENKKLLDAKQLIDMIPKTKEELFSYEINWSVYDKHQLHERMRPWISKKITEFLGEEEATFVDYIVSSTKDHVKASEMLQLLQPILDEEAEMFVLKMWRMLIFEIKKVETGLSMKSSS